MPHTYILVHQTRLSYTAVTENDHLCLTLAYVASNESSASRTLRRIFFLEAILTYRVVVVVGTSFTVAARMEEWLASYRRIAQ